ncbi:MAG: hypothetical protein ACTSR8_19190 [Promethearchaeota archaeon]
MGVLSKLFGKKETEEGFKQIESELSKLAKKTDSEMIGIFGTGGRLKGLPLIYIAEDENQLKRISAQLNEIINPINLIEEDQMVLDVVISYPNYLLYFKEIMKNISYFALLKDRNEILTHKQWVYKNIELMKDLFHE